MARESQKPKLKKAGNKPNFVPGEKYKAAQPGKPSQPADPPGVSDPFAKQPGRGPKLKGN